MRTNDEYRTAARAALKDNWAISALTAFVQSLLSSHTPLITIFVSNPLGVGVSNSFRQLLHGDNDVFGNAFNIGFEDYTHKVATTLLRDVYIILWSLLLCIPGIVKAYSYAMTNYIVVDNPDLDADAAIHRSRELMKGHKWDLFCLDLSFIGWAFLCLLTAGIGFFWLAPYMKTARAGFYDDLVAGETTEA